MHLIGFGSVPVCLRIPSYGGHMVGVITHTLFGMLSTMQLACCDTLKCLSEDNALWIFEMWTAIEGPNPLHFGKTRLSIAHCANGALSCLFEFIVANRVLLRTIPPGMVEWMISQFLHHLLSGHGETEQRACLPWHVGK